MEISIEELMKQGEAQFQRGNIQVARECFEKILSLKPDHLEAKNNLGVVLFHLGQIDEAIGGNCQYQRRRNNGCRGTYRDDG
jgi:Flp pilus assembly protein TadD